MSWFDLARRLPALWQNIGTRNHFLGSVGVLAGISGAIATYAFLREPLRVRLDRLTLHLPNSAGHLPSGGLRLLHLSDTHFRGANWREQAKIDCIRTACAGLEVDLLIHTGDFLQYDSGLPNVLALLDALPTPRLGTYAVFGNHDYCIYSHDNFLRRAWHNFQALDQAGVAPGYTSNGSSNSNGHEPSSHRDDDTNQNGQRVSGKKYREQNGGRNGRAASSMTAFAHARTLYQFGQYCVTSPVDFERSGSNDFNALEAALAERNVQILHNRYIHMTHPERDVDIYLAGVDDVIEGTAQLPHALAEIPYDAPTILLSHNPDILAEPGIEQVDLLLSGHTHGGQVVLPLLGPAHTQSQFLTRKEVAGYLRRGKTQVYITRGVGEGIPLRFGATPQVTLITLLPA